jgi:thioredoxin 1
LIFMATGRGSGEDIAGSTRNAFVGFGLETMMSRLLWRAALALLVTACAAMSAMAAERGAFDQKAFADAQSKGQSILIDISAPWCPTCAAQKPIIDKLTAEPQYKDLAIFDVDFDSRKDVLRLFGAQRQSTLIVFKGSQETGRSVGSTDASEIGALLHKAL